MLITYAPSRNLALIYLVKEKKRLFTGVGKAMKEKLLALVCLAMTVLPAVASDWYFVARTKLEFVVLEPISIVDWGESKRYTVVHINADPRKNFDTLVAEEGIKCRERTIFTRHLSWYANGQYLHDTVVPWQEIRITPGSLADIKFQMICGNKISLEKKLPQLRNIFFPENLAGVVKRLFLDKSGG